MRWILLCSIVLAAGCSSDDGKPHECEEGQLECVDDHARWCSVTEEDGAYWVDTKCLSAELCQENADHAFCTLEPEPNPVCDGIADGVACDGNVRVFCVEGYVAESSECLACSAAAGPENCQGGFGTACETTDDCVGGLECLGQSCTLACSCALGEHCAECRNALVEVPWPDDIDYVCEAGACRVFSSPQILVR